MQLLRIAFRNMGRTPARTALSVVAVAAAVAIVIVAKGTIDGILQTMEDGTIRLSSGHVRIIDREYEARERLLSLQYPVDGFGGEGIEPMTGALRDVPEVAEVVPRLRFGAMVSRGEELQGVMVMGGVPEVEEELMQIDRYLAEGRYVDSGAREAVLGRRLLGRLGLDVGDHFTLVFSTSLGALKGYTFDVVGALESGLPALDDGTVFVPLDVAQQMVGLQGAATEILLMADEERHVPAMLDGAEALVERLGAAERYAAIPWYDHNEIMKLLSVAGRIYNVIYFAILLLASFVVINTFVMIVNERRQEIGMLSALGLRPRQIKMLFVLEGGMNGILGSVAGAGIGTALLWVLSRVGITFPGTDTLDAALMYPSQLYPLFNASVISYAFVAGLAVTVLAAYFPARQAARMRPTEALRA